jgi:hypothetical protein
MIEEYKPDEPEKKGSRRGQSPGSNSLNPSPWKEKGKKNLCELWKTGLFFR